MGLQIFTRPPINVLQYLYLNADYEMSESDYLYLARLELIHPSFRYTMITTPSQAFESSFHGIGAITRGNDMNLEALGARSRISNRSRSCKPHAHAHAPLACIVDSGTHQEGGVLMAPHIQRLNGWRGRTRQNGTTNNFTNTKVFLVSSGG